MFRFMLLFVLGVSFHSFASTQESEADKIFTEHFSEAGPGCSVQLRVARRVVYEKGFGSARLPEACCETDRVLNSPSTRFRVASVSKAIVALGVLRLRDKWLKEKRADFLDSTIGDVMGLEGIQERYVGIRVRELLNHTSGFYREPPATVKARSDAAFLSLLKDDEAAINTDLLKGKSAISWHYSNLGYFIAAGLMEIATQMRWTKFMAREIFKPLGMRSTSIEDAEPLQEKGKVATGYDETKGGYQRVELGARRRWLASGGVITTVRDLGRLAAAIEEKSLLSADSWKESIVSTPLAVKAGERYPYALGWSVNAKEAGKVTNQWHSGGGLGTSTFFEIDKRDGCETSVAILCNYDNGFSRLVLWKAATRLRQIYCPPAESHKK